MNSTTKEIVDEAKRKLSDERRKHPEHFSNQDYERYRLEFYVKAALEKEIKERAKGYSSFLDKDFWECIGKRALEIFAELAIGSIVFSVPVYLVLTWFDIHSPYVTTLIVSAFIGLVVWEVIVSDNAVENFKAGVLYGELHISKKYHDALEEVKKGHDTA